MEQNYKYEMHCHAREYGWCAKVPTETLVPAYANAGYQGICMTNHYIDFAFELMRANTWAGKIDFYLESYRKAKLLAQAYDMDIILGMEIRFTNDDYNDFLVYGMDEDLLYRYPDLYKHTPASFKRFCEEHGLMIFQAHPLRLLCHPVEPEYLDGYEIFNANPRAVNNNDEVEILQKQNKLLGIGGSDYHQLPDLARSGCIFHERIRDGKALVNAFKKQAAHPAEPVFEIIRPH